MKGQECPYVLTVGVKYSELGPALLGLVGWHQAEPLVLPVVLGGGSGNTWPVTSCVSPGAGSAV